MDLFYLKHKLTDLCQVCKNFKDCPQGEGDKLNPRYVVITYWENGKNTYIQDLVECDLFKEYPKREK